MELPPVFPGIGGDSGLIVTARGRSALCFCQRDVVPLSKRRLTRFFMIQLKSPSDRKNLLDRFRKLTPDTAPAFGLMTAQQHGGACLPDVLDV